MPDPWFRYGIARPFATPLRLGLLVDDEATLPAWAARTTRTLLDSGVAELVLVAVPARRRRRDAARAVLAHPAWSIARATIWRSRAARPERTAGFLAPEGRVLRVALERTRAGARRLAAADVTRIRDARLDVLLRFGQDRLEGEVLEAARHGLWSFQHSDERRYRGQPVAFWELFDRSPEIGVVLQREAHDRGDLVVLRRALLAVEPHSYRVTLDRAYQASTDLPLQVCRDLLAGRTLPTAVLTERAPHRSPPGWRDVARVLGSTVLANVRRWLYGAFMLKQWSIGRLRGGPQRIVAGSLDGARWLRPSGRTRMLADPMIVPGSGGRVVLCEAQDFAVGRGVIIRVEVPDHDGRGGAPWLLPSRIRPVVDLPIHLSFPTVVTSDDGLFMIPEAAISGGLLSARLDDDVTAASDFESAPGLAAVDPVVFRHGDRWWLACTERGPLARSHLWMFHGPGVRGPWTAHPRNPVVIDAGCARAAGLPFVHDGALYRPAQDGRLGYGRSIRVMRVLTLTPEEYAEELAAEIDPDPSSPFGLGVHTVSVEGDTIWIDGYRAVMHPLAGWFRMRARRSPAVLVGRRVDGWAA